MPTLDLIDQQVSRLVSDSNTVTYIFFLNWDKMLQCLNFYELKSSGKVPFGNVETEPCCLIFNPLKGFNFPR